jgi:hypothetical protein
MAAQPSKPAPIACTLGAGDFGKRLGWIAELNATWLRDYRRDDLRLELVYAPGAREQVLELVRREQECCAFLTFEVREAADAVRLIIVAPEAARGAAETVFEQFRSKGPAPAAIAVVAALACGVCCVLPLALPATALAVTGGVLGWVASL